MKFIGILLICLLALSGCFDLYSDALDSKQDDSLLVFQANSNEIWVYDGVNAPRSLSENAPTWTNSPSNFKSFNGDLFFNGNDGGGNSLWRYDLDTDSFNEQINSADPQFLTVYNDSLYFKSNPDDQLWVYNGPGDFEQKTFFSFTQGTTIIFITEYNDKIYFEGYDDTVVGDEYRIELNSYDSKTDIVNTRIVNTNPDGDGYVEFVGTYNDKLYFSVNNVGTGTHDLWTYNGTSTELLSNMFDDTPRQFTVYKNELYFKATHSADGVQLKKTDGNTITTNPTIPLLNTVADAFSFYSYANCAIDRWVVYNNKLCFPAYYNIAGTETGLELIEFDGTSYTPREINSGNTGGNVEFLTIYKDKLYFHGQDAGGTSYLYIYDGSGNPKIIPETDNLNPQWLYVWERKKDIF